MNLPCSVQTNANVQCQMSDVHLAFSLKQELQEICKEKERKEKAEVRE